MVIVLYRIKQHKHAMYESVINCSSDEQEITNLLSTFHAVDYEDLTLKSIIEIKTNVTLNSVRYL